MFVGTFRTWDVPLDATIRYEGCLPGVLARLLQVRGCLLVGCKVHLGHHGIFVLGVDSEGEHGAHLELDTIASDHAAEVVKGNGP